MSYHLAQCTWVPILELLKVSSPSRVYGRNSMQTPNIPVKSCDAMVRVPIHDETSPQVRTVLVGVLFHADAYCWAPVLDRSS
jgi:hypothetical protein